MSETSGQIAVSVHDLQKRFGQFVAVDRVSFDVGRGEIFGFLGPNGAGKSTTIRMLCGILSPSGGSGQVAGLDIIGQAEQVKQNIGYMSQRFSLYEDLTVEENLDFYGGVYRIAADRKAARKAWALEMAGLTEHRTRRTGTLPAGWKQRLALGCAILHEPPILFLDEPTSGVDPISRRAFWDLIYQLAGGGVTVFVTTHYMDEAEYCDRLGLIYQGQLIAIGTGVELKTRYMKDDVLEVVCDGPADVMDDIERLPGVKEVALFARSLHVVAAAGSPAEQNVRQYLEQRGQVAVAITKILPSLEDVFVWLIQEHDRAARGEGGRP